eukprot:CAMPEP_0180537262 /NCGR_PEP_ID=MMETSP1036_2-20121128/65721_1 /TAXON_ID=632150 /ORGANISM="Azadinium spinosum, Strain 3D9" /LENGTH=41 /DNA_ID= /DNA_START= /DNA_END= /DNA_ORIENTATION=
MLVLVVHVGPFLPASNGLRLILHLRLEVVDVGGRRRSRLAL